MPRGKGCEACCYQCGEWRHIYKDMMCQSCYQYAWWQNNRSRIDIWKKEYKLAHLDEISYQIDQQHIRNNNRKHLWYMNNKQSAIKRAARWKAFHPDNLRIYQARRAARKRMNVATLTVDQWAHIKRIYRYCCVYCGRKDKRLTMDHVVPLSKGGGTTAANIVPACLSCNSAKGNRPPNVIPMTRLLL